MIVGHTIQGRCLIAGLLAMTMGSFVGCGAESVIETGVVERGTQALSGHRIELPKTEQRPNRKDTSRHPLDKKTDLNFYEPQSERKAHWQDDEDDPRFVRETGFRPMDEDGNDPRFVRETGFIPSPRIYLASQTGDVATVRWNRVDGADHYVVNGIRFSPRGGAAESFDLRVDSAQARVDTLGRVTQVMVVALSENGRVRSRPSNKLSLAPADD